MSRAFGAWLVIPIATAGCLSNSYTVPHNELVRLADTPPENRWQSVRAVQQIGGSDNPPEDETTTVASGSSHVGVFVYAGPTYHAHHHHHHYNGPPPPARHVAAPKSEGARAAATPSPGGGPGGAVTDGGPATKATDKGNGSSDSAIVAAVLVATGAAIGIGAAVSQGAKYDGWVAVHPDEPLRLRLSNGQISYVPLSELTPDLAASTKAAMIYEGESPRFPRLGRAPLDRTGFTLSTAFHLAGVPGLDRTAGTGLGGYFQLGGNISNMVTLGLAATADSGVDTRYSVLLATVGPEITLFPSQYFGLYAGAGLAFRNSYLSTGTRADQGWVLRAGLAGELPLTTHFALMARGGVARYDLDANSARSSWEGLLGFAVY